MNTHLLCIDMQKDFCSPDGSLYVKGAEHDVDRLALFINKNKYQIKQIHKTLDLHHKFSIFHSCFWMTPKYKNPNPFTVISVEDVLSKKLFPVNDHLYARALDYVTALKTTGKYALVIWPEHCILGSEGATVMPNLLNSLMEWEEANCSGVNFVMKGMNKFTENYSAIKAEVVDPTDNNTDKNVALIQELSRVDRILVAGEASSHCVSSTVMDLIDAGLSNKLVYLRDASSPVPGFEKNEKDFIRHLIANKVNIGLTTDVI